MEIIGTILIGLIAGIIAKFLLPGRDPGGCIITILLGIAGAFVATYLGKFLGIYEPGETAGFIGAIIGALIILLLYRVFLKKKN
ncbi:MAG: transglycosylase [Ignavibacteriaceae bacterium]|nr:transglycosylase [Ignavibacteriaceae bacterium]